MQILVDKEKAIELLRKRIGELEDTDLFFGDWKKKTQFTIEEIFVKSHDKWRDIYSLFPQFNDPEQVEQKAKAKKYLELYIEQIEELVIVNHKAKYDALLKKHNELVDNHKKVTELGDKLLVFHQNDTGEIEKLKAEIERLNKETIQWDNVGLGMIWKHLTIGQIVTILASVVSLLSIGFGIGSLVSGNMSNNEQYDLKVERDEYKKQVEVLRDSLQLEKKKDTISGALKAKSLTK